MTEIRQRTLLVGYSDSGDYEYWETYIPFDGLQYHPFIVEERADGAFQLWQLDKGYPASGRAFYRPEESVGLSELTSAGYGDAPRIRVPESTGSELRVRSDPRANSKASTNRE
ncbi:hypothetical protein DXT68_04015 [Microbacterium foliorum]|uniref:Uncharacterized protein n=1 Tax=Microbacterium foliorum TaxID=104336 RepID=A0A0F0KDR4_9MICO|nr:hypothetical protein [Microbacterium foliorum]AXL11392.1 hypothetical protein DXT68_04015 [Microbacterium foliorum]KJL19052.1 hypothetical protein RN50_02330 [Microbacterium foliorum]